MSDGTAMSSRLQGAWTAGVAPLQARWKALAKREQRLVMIAVALVVIALLWWVAVAPAWRSVQSAPSRLDQLDAQLQGMQRLASEARSLRATPAVSPQQSQAALRAATDALAGAGRLVITGERATLTFDNASSTQVRDWLAEARGAARARPIEANLSRGAQGFNGTVVVALPAGGSP
jgi:general secretion pathway protein M